MHTTFTRHEDRQDPSSLLCLLAGCCSSYWIFPIVWGIAAAFALPPLFGWSHYIPDSSGIRYIFGNFYVNICSNLVFHLNI